MSVVTVLNRLSGLTFSAESQSALRVLQAAEPDDPYSLTAAPRTVGTYGFLLHRCISAKRRPKLNADNDLEGVPQSIVEASCKDFVI